MFSGLALPSAGEDTLIVYLSKEFFVVNNGNTCNFNDFLFSSLEDLAP